MKREQEQTQFESIVIKGRQVITIGVLGAVIVESGIQIIDSVGEDQKPEKEIPVNVQTSPWERPAPPAEIEIGEMDRTPEEAVIPDVVELGDGYSITEIGTIRMIEVDGVSIDSFNTENMRLIDPTVNTKPVTINNRGDRAEIRLVVTGEVPGETWRVGTIITRVVRLQPDGTWITVNESTAAPR